MGRSKKNEAKVTFVAETKEFNEGISKMDSQLRTMRSELKLNETQMKNTGNTAEGLRKKNEILKKEQQAAAEKTALLSKKLEVAKEMFGENSEQAQKLQRDLNYAKNAEAKIQAEINETNAQLKAQKKSAADVGKSMQEMGDKITSAGEAMTKTVTAAGVALAAGSVAAYKSTKEGYDAIAEGTGAIGDKLEELKDVADDVFTSMDEDMSNVGTAVADINTRFGFTGDTLEKASAKFLQYAKINKEDVATSIKTVSRMMGDAGIEAKDYAEVLDAITAASQNSGKSTSELAELLTTYGAPMRALGFEWKESLSLFAQWEKAGVNTSIAFSGMKTAISKWSAEGKDAREEFKKTLEEIGNCPDIASATTKAIEVFGKKAGPDLADAIKGGRFSYEDFLKVVSNSKDTVTNTFEATEGPIEKFNATLNKIKLTASEFGETILEEVEPVIDDLGDAFDSLNNWFTGLDSNERKALLGFTGFATALGPVLVVFGKGVGIAGQLVTAFGSLGASGAAAGSGVAAAGVGASSALGPIALVVAAVAALIALFVTFYKKSENFRSAINSGLAEIRSAWNNMKKDIDIEELQTSCKEFYEEIKPALIFLGQLIEVYLVTKLSIAKSQIVGFINTLAPMISATANLISYWTKIIKAFSAFMTGDFKSATAYFKSAMASQEKVFKNVLSAIVRFFDSSAKSLLNSLMKYTGLTNQKIAGACNGVLSKIRNTVSAIGKAINTIRNMFNIELKFKGIKIPKITASWDTSGAMAAAAKAIGLQGIPKFSVKWLANGLILKKPQFIGALGDKLLGAGEAGPEAVAPISKLQGYVYNSVVAASDTQKFDYDKMGEKFENAVDRMETTITLNEREIGRTVRKVMA